MKKQMRLIILLLLFFIVNTGFAQPISGSKVKITDGARDASVRDTGSSDSLNVAITDGSGNQITSFGGGTEYTEDAASAADPVGKANILVRTDTPSTITTTNGDNVAQRGTNYGAALTQIITSSGSFVDSFGGGSQYTEGDTDATITGTAMVFETNTGTNTLGVVSSSNPLPITPVAAFPVTDNAGSLTVDGTVTCNAGTNLNTSALATSANQSTEITSLQLLDDVVATDGSAALTKAYQIAGTDGTNAQILSTNTLGHLYVEDASGYLASIDANTTDPKNTDGTTATTNGLMIGGTDGTNYQHLSTNASGHLNIADGGNSITVDGTVAATQSGTWNINNISGTVSLPTGAATLAEQQTQTTALQLIDDTVATNGAAIPAKSLQCSGTDGTNARPIAVDASGFVKVADGGGVISVDGSINVAQLNGTNVSMGNGVSGSGVQRVTIASDSTGVIAATQSGTWSNRVTDGTLTASVRDTGSSDSLNVAITDGSGNQITSFGGGTQYTEDAASVADPVGNQLLVRRRDSLSTETTTDGDVTAANATSKGELYVKHVDSLPVTDNGGSLTIDGTVAATQSGTWNINNVSGTVSLPTGASTLAEQQTQTTALQLLDDVVATDGSAALTKGNQIAGTDGTNAQILSTNASGHLNIADGGNSITVDGTVASTQSGTWILGANSGVDIGDVTINNASIPVTQSGTWDEVGINDSGNSITVDGTVAVTQSTASNLKAQVQVIDGVGDSAMDNTNDAVRVNVVAGGAGDGAILDGVSSSIKATVFDYTNANPVACRLTDTNGDYVSVGGGTQYTEDAASASDPVGTQLIARRRDSLSTETTTDGDNTAVNTTSKGELYVKHVDSIPVTDNGGSLTVDGTVAATQSGAWNVTNISGTVSLPTGASTLAEQQTQTTSLQLIDDAVATNAAAIPTKSLQCSGTDGTNARPIAVDTSGFVKITDAGTTISVDGSINVAQLNGTNVSMGNGVSGAGVQRVTIASDSTGVIGATQSGTWNINNVSGTVSLPTGASTLAEQQTQTTALQLLDDVVATDGSAALTKGNQIAGTDGTNAQILSTNASGHLNIADGGNSITVDGTVASTQSGTWILGANSGVDIGDVTINNASIPVTQSGTWDEVGINDSGNSITVDDGGSSLTVDGSGTFTTADNQTITDNAGFTDGTSKLFTNGFIYDEVAGTALTENDAAAGRINVNRAQVATIEDGATRGRYATVTAANAVKVDGSAVTQPVSGTVTCNAGTNLNTANSEASLSVLDDWDNAASTGAKVSGDIAHDAIDSGEPVKVGYRAIAVGSTPTEVAANDRTQGYAIRAGVPFSLNGHPDMRVATENITDADGVQSNTALVSVSAGSKIVVTWYSVKCDQDNTNDYDFRMGFGTASTPALDNDTKLIADLPGIAPGSGFNSGQVFFIGADDEDVRFNLDDPAGGACSVMVNYFVTSS